LLLRRPSSVWASMGKDEKAEQLLKDKGGKGDKGKSTGGKADENQKLPSGQASEEKDMDFKEPLMPWTAVVCIVYAAILFVAISICAAAAPISERFLAPNPAEIWHAKVAILLIVSAAATEVCFLVSSATNAVMMGSTISAQLQMHRMGDSALTLTEYGQKAATGLYMWLMAGGIVHTDSLAWGGPRPVYLARFVQWSLAVPTLLLISNRALIKDPSFFVLAVRSMPGVIAVFLFTWAAWLMEVTTSPSVRWTMYSSCLMGHTLVSIDQLNLAYVHRHDDHFAWKLGMLVYQITFSTAYAVVFSCGRFGVLSSVTEQCIYAYTDASVKVFQGALLAMIRQREDLTTIRHWWVAALTASKDLESLITQARVPVFALDLDGNIIEWNDNLTKLTGLTLEDVRGKPLVEVAAPDSREFLEKTIQNVLEMASGKDEKEDTDEVHATSTWTGNFVELSIPVVANMEAGATESAVATTQPAHTARQLAMTLVPRSTNDGDAAGVMGIGQDLSDITQLRIIQDRKSALMAMLSHEIRSPLHGMVGLAGAMLQSEAGKALHRQLGMVKGCASRLLDLVSNIMDLAQHEKRKKEGKPIPKPTAPVNFTLIAEEVTVMTNMAVDKMNKPLIRPTVRLVNKLAGTRVPIIRGDQQKCTQLVYNLVTNACKFTETGTVTIQARHLEEQNRLEVDVVDTGRGISKEGQTRIFQAFEQEQNGDTRSFQGIGLGLAVCTEIVELHGGELRVRSELGQGSTFTASFPCAPELGFGTDELPKEQRDALQKKGESTMLKPPGAEVEPVVAPAVAALAPLPEPPVKQEREIPLVLSVDDDEVNQEVVRGALRGLCDIYCAMGGNEAIRYLESRKAAKLKLPDTVLLDIQMPGMDGFEVCEEIRKRFEAAHSRMPIIMISAKAPVDQTAIHSFSIGTTDFVAKPFNTEVLRRKIQVVLKAKQDFDIGGATTTVAREAHLRLTETQQKLDEEQKSALKYKEERDQALKKAKDGEAKLSNVFTKLGELQKFGDEHRQKIKDLEEENAKLKEEAKAQQAAMEQLKEQQQKQKEQEKEQQQEQQRQQQQQASAEQAKASAAELEAAKHQAKAAEAAREAAERKAQEMSSMVEKLTDKLRKQESVVQNATAVTTPSLPASTATSQFFGGEVATGDPSIDRDVASRPPSEQQRSLINALLQQLCGARAVVRALSSRIEILNTLAHGCVDMMEMQPPPDSGYPMLQYGGEMRFQVDHARSVQLDWYKTVTRILGAQLSMMAHMSTPPEDLTALTLTDDPGLMELCDGFDEANAEFNGDDSAIDAMYANS